jgi:hypothetical protein
VVCLFSIFEDKLIVPHLFSDVNDCASSPCKNGGSCEDQLNGYKCLCVDGYEGHDCQVGMLLLYKCTFLNLR